jgi:hypothetical protein
MIGDVAVLKNSAHPACDFFSACDGLDAIMNSVFWYCTWLLTFDCLISEAKIENQRCSLIHRIQNAGLV